MGDSEGLFAHPANLVRHLALRASGIAHRCTEEEGAEAFFPRRATTTVADSTRDARAGI